MRYRSLCLSAIRSLAILALPSFSWATHVVGSAPWDQAVTVDAGISYSTVSATESVFDDSVAPGYRLSQLDWEADLTLASVSASIRNQRWVLNAGVWSSLDTMDGSLVDRDWLYSDIPDWSDESIGGADLDMTSFDVNGGFTVIQSTTMAIDLVVGYREDDLSWTDFGGTYIYSTYGFRDDVGVFEDEVGIAYDQTTQVPYVGAHAHLKSNKLTFSGYVLYSPIADVSDTDYHISREIHFVDTFPETDYVGAGIKATWHISPNLQAGVALDYQNFQEVVGDETVVEDGETYADGAGFALESQTASVTVGYSF